MRIFVSYRRQDSAGWAGRLVRDVSERIGTANVFQDIQSIEPAENWYTALQVALQKADHIFVVIGPMWLKAADPAGRRRLDDPEDLVRLEVAAALRHSRSIIPLLVGGAKMPVEAALPDDIKPLAQRQAIELTDRRWLKTCDSC